MPKLPIFDNPLFFGYIRQDYLDSTVGSEPSWADMDLTSLPRDYACSMLEPELGLGNLTRVLEGKMSRLLDALLEELTDEDGKVNEPLLGQYMIEPVSLDLSNLPGLDVLRKVNQSYHDAKAIDAFKQRYSTQVEMVVGRKIGWPKRTGHTSHPIFQVFLDRAKANGQSVRGLNTAIESTEFVGPLSSLLWHQIAEPYLRALEENFDGSPAYRDTFERALLKETSLYFFFSNQMNNVFPPKTTVEVEV